MLRISRRNLIEAESYHVGNDFMDFSLHYLLFPSADFFKTLCSWFSILDWEPRGASLAEKVTNFYACSSDLHTLSYVKVVVCQTHGSGYGQGGR